MSKARQIIEALLDQRGSERTICPSEAAKALADDDDDWRELMDEVHQAVDAMLASGEIKLSWKGERKEQRRGPYRIARRCLPLK